MLVQPLDTLSCGDSVVSSMNRSTTELSICVNDLNVKQYG